MERPVYVMDVAATAGITHEQFLVLTISLPSICHRVTDEAIDKWALGSLSAEERSRHELYSGKLRDLYRLCVIEKRLSTADTDIEILRKLMELAEFVYEHKFSPYCENEGCGTCGYCVEWAERLPVLGGMVENLNTVLSDLEDRRAGEPLFDEWMADGHILRIWIEASDGTTSEGLRWAIDCPHEPGEGKCSMTLARPEGRQEEHMADERDCWLQIVTGYDEGFAYCWRGTKPLVVTGPIRLEWHELLVEEPKFDERSIDLEIRPEGTEATKVTERAPGSS